MPDTGKGMTTCTAFQRGCAGFLKTELGDPFNLFGSDMAAWVNFLSCSLGIKTDKDKDRYYLEIEYLLLYSSIFAFKLILRFTIFPSLILRRHFRSASTTLISRISRKECHGSRQKQSKNLVLSKPVLVYVASLADSSWSAIGTSF